VRTFGTKNDINEEEAHQSHRWDGGEDLQKGKQSRKWTIEAIIESLKEMRGLREGEGNL
jgi:hypothetical protein